MNECVVKRPERICRLVARDENGREIDSIEVSGPNAGQKGTQSGVEMGDGELRDMWHAKRSREDTPLVGVPGAVPGVDQIEVRKWTMRLVTLTTDEMMWEDVERRLWRLTSPDAIGRHTGFFSVEFTERNGETRVITVKRTGTPDPESDTYPGERGYEAWTFEVTAYDPWWYGAEEEFVWQASTSSSVIGKIRNPGDQLGFLKFVFPAANGPATWTIPDGEGVYPAGHAQAGQRIRQPLPLIEAGQIAEANQRPDRLPFRILGVPMSFGLMKQARLTHPLEPGLHAVDLPISVQTTATDAAVRVSLRPAYDRPHS